MILQGVFLVNFLIKIYQNIIKFYQNKSKMTQNDLGFTPGASLF